MNDFLKKLNELTNNKYDYLRLSKTEFQLDNNTMYIEFMVPYDIFIDENKFSNEDKILINSTCSKIIPQNILLKISYNRIQLSSQVIKRYIVDFIRENYYIILEDRYEPNKIEVNIKNNKTFIKIPVDESLHSFCVNKGVGENLKKFLDSKYSNENFIEFLPIKLSSSFEKNRKDKQIYIDDGIVELKKGFKVVGSTISNYPLYISRFKEPKENVTICGKVTELEKKISKGGRLFYVFTLVDPTDSAMRCIYFSKGKTKSSFDCVHVGESLLVNGSLKSDNYGAKKLVLFVDNASKATIDFEGTKKKIDFMKKIKLKQMAPTPVPYRKEEEKSMYSLFEEQPYICPLLREKTFVVFDLETTGLNIASDKIVEIGAAKIENGNIISTYNTLIDPQIPMPVGASSKNNIYDYMLESAPYIQDVIESFIDYIKGSILVGHNINTFDYPFIKRVASEYGFEINNDTIDTMYLNSQVNKNAKRESLSNIAKRYNINLKQAHRALNDTLATAEIFILFANKLKLEN